MSADGCGHEAHTVTDSGRFLGQRIQDGSGWEDCNPVRQVVGPLPRRRLVVELNGRTAADLAWLVEAEELNKTNVVNRAVQVYRMIVEAQRNGGSLTIDDPARGGAERLLVI